MEDTATHLENISNDVNENEVRSLLEENYNIVSEKIKRLDGYDDFNFHILPSIKMSKTNNYTQICLHGYVLKIMSWENSADVELVTEYINILLYLKDQNIRSPFPIQNNTGKYKTYWRKKDVKNEEKGLDPVALQSLERIHIVLLFEFIPGKLLSDVRFGEKFCFSVGHMIGKLHQAMKPFSNSKVLQRPHFLWSLKYVADSLKYAQFVRDEAKRSMVTKAIVDFQNEVVSRMNELEQDQNYEQYLSTADRSLHEQLLHYNKNILRSEELRNDQSNYCEMGQGNEWYFKKFFKLRCQFSGIIHGDLNKANILIRENGENDPEICGIIDFSDVSYSCYLFDLAITILYISMDEPNSLENFTSLILSGYSRKLSDLEMNLLKTCICARISQSLILGLYSYHLCPSNTYLLSTQKQGWPLLEKLQNQKNESFVASIKEKISSEDQM